MSDAKKCDRCGGYYAMGVDNDIRPSCNGVRIFGVRYLSARGQRISDYDLCPNCAGKVWKYISEYDEPVPKLDPIEKDESLGQQHLKEVCPRCIHFNDHGTYGQSVCRVCLGGVSMYKYNVKKFEGDDTEGV